MTTRLKRQRKFNFVRSMCDQEVALQPPFYAIRSQGARLVLGEICELCDCYVLSVLVRSDDTLVSYLAYYESYHHFITGSDGMKLYCAYIQLPRFLLAMRNSSLFADLVISCPLELSEPH